MKQLAVSIEMAAESLAERFGTTTANFTCFGRTHDSHTVATIAYTGLRGLDMGEGLRSWREIFDDKHDALGTFLIQVGDTTYDCRQGMTKTLYSRMVELRKHKRDMLPDSQESAEAAGVAWTWTMLTGECVLPRPDSPDAKERKAFADSLEMVRQGFMRLRETTSVPLACTLDGKLYIAGSSGISTPSSAVRFRPAIILEREE